MRKLLGTCEQISGFITNFIICIHEKSFFNVGNNVKVRLCQKNCVIIKRGDTKPLKALEKTCLSLNFHDNTVLFHRTPSVNEFRTKK